ncbi:hypothetical protein [Terrisporobacter petrolearius]|nr:hypothetical protein [Terrisporobacter petrolearius]
MNFGGIAIDKELFNNINKSLDQKLTPINKDLDCIKGFYYNRTQ